MNKTSTSGSELHNTAGGASSSGGSAAANPATPSHTPTGLGAPHAPVSSGPASVTSAIYPSESLSGTSGSSRPRSESSNRASGASHDSPEAYSTHSANAPHGKTAALESTHGSSATHSNSESHASNTGAGVREQLQQLTKSLAIVRSGAQKGMKAVKAQAERRPQVAAGIALGVAFGAGALVASSVGRLTRSRGRARVLDFFGI